MFSKPTAVSDRLTISVSKWGKIFLLLRTFPESRPSFVPNWGCHACFDQAMEENRTPNALFPPPSTLGVPRAHQMPPICSDVDSVSLLRLQGHDQPMRPTDRPSEMFQPFSTRDEPLEMLQPPALQQAACLSTRLYHPLDRVLRKHGVQRSASTLPGTIRRYSVSGSKYRLGTEAPRTVSATPLDVELDQVRLLHLLDLREDEKVTVPQIEDKDLMAFLNSY